jgi:hypothetical protein
MRQRNYPNVGKFQHQHVSGYWIEYEPAVDGSGLVARRMVVESSIPLDREEPDFDLHAATDLQMEASYYASPSSRIGAKSLT